MDDPSRDEIQQWLSAGASPVPSGTPTRDEVMGYLGQSGDSDVSLPETTKAVAETPDGSEMVGQNWINWAKRVAKAPSPAWMQPAEHAIRQFATTPPAQIPVTEQSPGYQKLAAGIWNPVMGFLTPENVALGAAYTVQPEIGAALIASQIAPAVKPWWQQVKRLPQMTPFEGLQLGTETWSMLAAPFIHKPIDPFKIKPAEPMGPPTGGAGYVPPASREIPGAPSAPEVPETVPQALTVPPEPPLAAPEAAPAPPAPAEGVQTGLSWKLNPDNRYSVSSELATASAELEPTGDVRLRGMKVFPGRRRQGHGSQFIDSLMQDVNVMFPESQNVNIWSFPETEGFWEKQGFEKTGNTTRVGSAVSSEMARPTLREPQEPSGPTASSQELMDAAFERLRQLSAKDDLSQHELDERAFLMDNAENPRAIAKRFGVTIVEGGETDASRITSPESVVLRDEGGGVVPEAPLRQPGETPEAGEQPQPTGQPVAATPPPQPHAPGAELADPIVAAANRAPDGRIFTGSEHFESSGKAQAAGAKNTEAGFVTKSGKFLTPEQAHDHAIKQGQITKQEIADHFPSGKDEGWVDAAWLNLETEPIWGRSKPAAVSGPERPPAAAPPGRTFRVRTRTARDDFAFSEKTPVATYVLENGGLLSKTEAIKQGKFERNPDLWNNRPNLSHPTHNKIYKPTGEMPDLMAENLYREGLIPDRGHVAMYEELAKESQTTRKAATEERKQAKAVATEEAQATEFGKAQAKEKAAGARPIYSDALHEGDKVLVDDQEATVTNVDPDGVVTLEDGKRFGIQEVAPNEIIYGEMQISPERLAAESKAQQELKLSPPESVEEQAARTKREADEKAASEALKEKQAQVKYGWAQKKTGTTGDLGQLDLEGVEASQEELFSQGQKLKLKANKEGGFVNADILKEAADFGKRLYGKGMDFARWSGEMIRHLGAQIKEHLDSIWRSITGQNILPHARERGSFTLPAWQPREVTPDPTAVGGMSVSGEGSAHGIARVYIEDAVSKGSLPPEALELGVGSTPEQMQAKGIRYINAGHDPAQIIADLKRGIFSADRMAALWAERNRLGSEREAAQLESFRTGTAAARAKARAAEQAEINFLREARPIAAGETQKIMVAWQEARPGSLLTFDGLYRKALELNGHSELTDAQKVDLVRRSKTGEAIKAKQDAAVQKLSKAVDKAFPRKAAPTKEEMKDIMQKFKNRLPCA